MRKKSTRLLSAALAVCMMLSALPVGAFAAEPGAEEQENGASAQADPVGSEFVEINSTNFPDQVFLQYVKDNIDTADTTGQKDGKLSQAERDAVTEISITNTNCTDLTGIAYFANLKILYCNDNKLTGLDMSGNPALEQLLCYENKLESLNVTKNKNLSTLKCQHNRLNELNLKDNEKLTELNCSYNQLTTLDVSKNAKLRILECYNNSIAELNLGDITNLYWLLCATNNLTELDVSKNKYLEQLHCRHNNLRRLVIGNNYSLRTLYLEGNHLTSLDLYHKAKIDNFDYLPQSCTIDVKEDGTFDLSSLPDGFDASKTTDWEGGTRDGNTLNVNSHEVQYVYNTGSWFYRQNRMEVKLKVNGHKYQWQHDDTKHWRTCALKGCPGLTGAQEAKAPHVYDNAKDKDCNTCGYVRPLYTVTTGENVTAKLGDEVLNAPVAADTKVHLTATVPEGQHFIGWTVKVGDEEQKADTFLTPDKNDPTKATFTMPSKNVEVTANFASNPTLNPTLRVGDHVTATIEGSDASVPSDSTVPVPKNKIVHLTATAPGQHFISWTVMVGGEEADNFLTPDKNDPTKATFTMPAENVEIKANFEGNPTLNPTLRVGDHVTATIEGSDASVPSDSTVPVPKNKIVHLTATAPERQHFTGWTVKVGGEEQKADTFLTTPDESDPTKVTFTMPDANVEVTATFAEDSIPEPDPVGPSDTGNIQGAISAVVIGAAAGAIIYEAGTGIYRVINMPGIPMPSNRIELAELLWEHAGKPEPVSTALYSDIDEGDTDAQKAARWAVEQDLMKDDADNNKFHPAFPVSKLRTCLTWNAAKEKGLFDKTEE